MLSGMLTSCGYEPEQEPQTSQPLQTSVPETTAEPLTEPEPITELPEETTKDNTTETAEPTEPPEPEKLPARLTPFYEKLCSDRWVVLGQELDREKENGLRITFAADGGMKLKCQYHSEDDDAQHAWEKTYTASDRTWYRDQILYKGEYYFEDMEYEDCVHMITEGVVTWHSVMVRESAYNENRRLARQLKNSRWASDWFQTNGIDSVSIDDFDVFPVNETTAQLYYHDQVGDHTVEVTVKKTDDWRQLDAFLVSIYSVPGYCPETLWFAETWTRK